MSEQIHDQVSAFVDDELSAEECAFLVRRFERDPESRSKLTRYALIGAVMRREPLQSDPDVLRRRVSEALSGAQSVRPAAVANAAPATASRQWSNPAFGLGIAATVAVAALFTIRAVNQVGGIEDSNADALQSASISGAPSYVVPADVQENVIAAPPIRLTNYLMHHGEYASRLSRTSVHSNVVGAVGAPFIVEAVAIDDAPAGIQDERDAR